ncbi:MAG: enoyl-CoA hydratase/isomerase family protein [Bacteroidetes bacterium]|nr:MAG: enoyl-CoA hydratase/isomerase family protein [Bacteroidota bacterium]
MNLTQIVLERTGEIAWITLNRPEKLNALTQTMLAEWVQVLRDLSKDETCRVIVVSGAGKSWSAGVDLSVFQEIKVEPGYQMYQDGVEIMDLLENCPQVTIAMLNGYCFTGALEILMSFDLIVAAEEAKIGDTHAKWGIPPKWGMTQRLLRQVGIRKAKELSFTAQPVSGTEAARIGLVNRAVPLSELRPTVEALAAQIIQNSGQAIAAIKQLYQFGSLHTLKEGLAFERDYKAQFTDKTEDLKNFKKKI